MADNNLAPRSKNKLPWYEQALPMEGRATFLPYQDTLPGSVMNQRSFALPGIIAGAVNAFTAPGRAYSGSDQSFDPAAEAANFAMTTMGGGMGASRLAPAPRNALGMNTSGNSSINNLLIPKKDYVRIYRGSYQNEPKYTVEENPLNDVYGGVFGNSDLSAAKVHENGGLHYTDIPNDKILTHYSLNYEIPYEKVKEALLKAQPHLRKDPESFEQLYKIIIEDAGQDLRKLDDGIIDKLFAVERGDADNEAQRIRGQVSKNLGYKALEMTDEHGSGTYLVAPGAQFDTVSKN